MWIAFTVRLDVDTKLDRDPLLEDSLTRLRRIHTFYSILP
jgi:hypothetical protein